VFNSENGFQGMARSSAADAASVAKGYTAEVLLGIDPTATPAAANRAPVGGP
jgi:hypothetical protein